MLQGTIKWTSSYWPIVYAQPVYITATQLYVPTTAVDDADINEFCEQCSDAPLQCELVVLGNFNANVLQAKD